MINKNLERIYYMDCCVDCCCWLSLLIIGFNRYALWGLTEDGGYHSRDKCVRKEGGQSI